MRYSLKTLLIWTTVVGLLCGLAAWQGGWVLAQVLGVNLVGWGIGWVVTRLFKLPRDGSLRNEDRGPMIAGRLEPSNHDP